VKQLAQHVFQGTLAAIDIPATIQKTLARRGAFIQAGGSALDLREYSSLVAIAYGKASFAMAEGLSRVLAPDYRPEGILVVPAAPPRELPGWKIFLGGHPVPNAASFAAGEAILRRLAQCDEWQAPPAPTR